ncbi:MAG TPA: APC family permease [Vicinamibacteria bacterium]|nr:APC family permease [Vicinamibacteria bacterium]
MSTGLRRDLGLLGLVATGVCAMLGAGINVVPFMIQRNVPGIDGNVLLAYSLGVVPALLAALCYAILASAMPRAGGSYVFASRALSPYLGFVASFSQWFGISMAIGVVAYVLVPFLRDIAASVSFSGVAAFLETSAVRLVVPLAFLWLFTVVNLMGTKTYERTLVPLMVLMFTGGLVAIPAGFLFDHGDFVAAVEAREGVQIALPPPESYDWERILTASVLLFSSFIGFDAVAQAGGEAKNPSRNLPLAIVLSIASVGAYYMSFTAAIYHAVPWSFIAERAATTDLTAPGLLAYLLPPAFSVAIVAAATIALANDLPAMILSVSRLMFAWAEDEIFPRGFAAINVRYHTPHWAIVASAATASVGILLNHSAGDFFVGVDLLVTSMLVNFFLMALSVVFLPSRNPELARQVRFLTGRRAQLLVGGTSAVLLTVLIVLQVVKDLSTESDAWYYHAFYTYLIVLAVASCVFFVRWRKLERAGVDLHARFRGLPPN